MIDLYTWATPNGRKISIALEELGLPYTVQSVDITKGEQFAPAFLALSPNNKIPAIEDHETGVRLMESGAILLYLAERTGRLLSTQMQERLHTIEWLMWQMGGLGPMLGQTHFFLKYNKGLSVPAQERFHAEARRLYGVLERHLGTREYVMQEYSIADIAIWPWVSRFEWQEIDLRQFPRVREWYLRVASRPAVQRGYHVPAFVNEIPMPA